MAEEFSESNTKSPFKSLGMISSFATSIMPLLVLFGIDVSPSDVQSVKEGADAAAEGINLIMVAYVALTASFGGIYGRWRATKKIAL